MHSMDWKGNIFKYLISKKKKKKKTLLESPGEECLKSLLLKHSLSGKSTPCKQVIQPTAVNNVLKKA